MKQTLVAGLMALAILVATLAPLANLTFGGAGAAPVFAGSCSGRTHVVVKLLNNQVDIDELNANYGTETVQRFPGTRIYILTVVGQTNGAKAKATELNNSGLVVWAEAGELGSGIIDPDQFSGAALDQFSQATMDQFTQAALDQFSQASLDQFTSAALDQFSQAAMDQFTQATLDQFSQAALDQFTSAALDQFSTAVLDQFAQAVLDQFSQSVLDQFGQAALDQFTAAALDQFSQAALDQFSAAILDQFSAAALDQFNQAVLDQFSAATLDQFSSAIMDQFSTAILDQFSTAALDQFSAAALDQFSTAVMDQFSSAILDQFTQAMLDQFSTASLDQFSSAILDQFSSAVLDQFTVANMDQFTQASLDEFSAAVLDQFSTSVLDQFSTASLDQFVSAALDQFTTATLDQFSTASFDQFIQSVLDQFDTAYFETLVLDTLDTVYGSQARGQQPLAQVKTSEAHALSTGAGVVVAVIDSGVNDHWYLRDRIAPGGWDFVDNDADPSDELDGIDNDGDGYVDEGYSHGTHVAGIISLVAPDAQILPIRVQDSDGNGWSFIVAEGIQYAVDNGADVINVSLGMPCRTSVLRWAIKYAHDRGVPVIVSAGNENSSQINYPADFNKSIGVAAVDSNDVKAEFSNYGDNVKVSSPGVAIYSTYGNGVFAWWSGTSQATPMVTAGVALMLSLDPDLTPNDVKHKLKQNADNIDALNPGYVGDLGTGRINLLNSVIAVIN